MSGRIGTRWRFEDQSAQHRDRAHAPGKSTARLLRRPHQDRRAASDQRRLGDGQPCETGECVEGIGANLEQPVHVHPGRPAALSVKGSRRKQGPLMQDLAPGSQVPIDVSVGDRAQRNHEGPTATAEKSSSLAANCQPVTVAW